MSPKQRAGLRCILIKLVDRRICGEEVDERAIYRIERTLKMSHLQSQRKLGELNPRCKLTWEIVEDMRRELASRTDWGAQSAVARRYGVSKKAVRDIMQGKTWTKRPEPVSA